MNNFERVRELVNKYVSGEWSRERNKGRIVTVEFQDLLISGVSVEDEGYKIFNVSSEWAEKTTYLCEEAKDGTCFYYLETIDECIGEMQRLVRLLLGLRRNG